jgi:hypothetical protein
MVDYKAIINMLKHLGFGERFISWITNILTSASTSIILNGVPGKTIRCTRGVRQGDPLSPLLFVITAELLQIIINQAWHEGILELPLEYSYGQDYPIIQYADGTLLIMPADSSHLMAMKEILEKFTISTGFKINFRK